MGHMGSSVAGVVIKNGYSIGVVYLDRVLVSKHPGPATTALWAASLTCWRFLGSFVTAMQRQPSCPSIVRISLSTDCLIVPGCLSFSFPSTLDVSIVQYRMAEDAGAVGTTGSFALANTEAYDDDGDPPVESSVLSVKLPFIESYNLLVVVDIMSSWALVVSSWSLVSSSWLLTSASSSIRSPIAALSPALLDFSSPIVARIVANRSLFVAPDPFGLPLFAGGGGVPSWYCLRGGRGALGTSISASITSPVGKLGMMSTVMEQSKSFLQRKS
jgi:hypothetical protein